VLAEVFDQAFEVAQRTKKAMQKHQRLTVPFFNVFELILLFDFVIHGQSMVCSAVAKINDLLQ
jgi:hypothetical protein